ncbi:MAG: hypothetical protein GX262_04575 [Clostridia bacterium]|nr:hypothetical protein [Clostridia bacterium]
MSLVANLFQALRLNEQGYRRLIDSNKSFRGGALVVGTVGLAYGLTNIILFRELLTMMSSRASEITGALAIIMSGLSIAYLVHISVTLLVWAISKGFRGPGRFGLLYGNLGVAMAPLVFAVPLLNYLWLSGGSGVAYLLAAPFLAWLWVSLVQAIRATEGHSYGIATGVLAVTTIFTGCLLYLWLP